MALASATTSELINYSNNDKFSCKNIDGLNIANNYIKKLIEYVNNLQESDAGVLFTGYDARFTKEENQMSMIGKQLQKVTLAIMDNNIDEIIKTKGIDPKEYYLAMSGGVALNCPMNSYLMNKYKFKGFISTPHVSDSGMSIGIGLYHFYKEMGKFDFHLKNAFYGDEGDLNAFLDKGEFSEYIASVTPDETAEQIIEDIQTDAIVWFYGRAEIGPRGLGHRSILADPRTEKSQITLNQVKQRQWWRPVAPIVLEEAASDWFEDVYPSPYMLHTFKIKEDKLKEVPAIAHIDKSARIQTVNQNDDAKLYEVLSAFYDKTGVPILCNTSLNDRGEPIINTIEEAMNFALRKGFKVMYVNSARLVLQNQECYQETEPYKRRYSDFMLYKTQEERQQLVKELNPYDLPMETLVFYFQNDRIRNNYSLTDSKDAKKLLRLSDLTYRMMGFANTEDATIRH